MINRPQWKQHLRAELLSDDRLALVSETDQTEIHGRLFATLAPFLDGQHTFSEIVDAVQAEASVLDVSYGLSTLQELGHIVDAKDRLPAEFSAFRDLLGADPGDFDDRLRSTRVRVSVFGGVSSQEFVTRLTSLNIRVEDEGDLWVALTDDYLQPRVAELSREAERQQRALMLFKPVGAVLWMGPILLPGGSPCFECLTKCLEENRSAPVCHFPSTFHAGVNMAATQVFAWVANRDRERLSGRILTWDALSLETRSHAFRRHPHCSRYLF